MKFNSIAIFLLLFMGIACAQSVDHKLDGTWHVTSKTDTEAQDGTVIDLDEEMYEKGEKTYHFAGNTLTITEGFGNHKKKLPIKVTGDQLFIGKHRRNKEPYEIAMSGNRLVLTKIKIKKKKGRNQRTIEVVTLEKQRSIHCQRCGSSLVFPVYRSSHQYRNF
ncbi:hypothetical protein [Sphingobacterium haloxyli]|uniref:Lipocalin-like domain-containing protein n=1 Tax=Sphingobacterium haloxyli TaxID=2100533 RepID=A0A2S9IWV2_9SPHI|nr:hypothetical protein [Sphingobacterium haloxyli]PRD44999.1 hypothetical protein C5745_18705 [Sphingobacterium haloxyli]